MTVNNTQVLIVEDEAIIALTLKEMLKELGYFNVKIANTENQAIAQINNNSFQLVILDINLNVGEEGIELGKICMQKCIPFFYLSSYTDKSTLDRALETAPGAYIIKPFLPENVYTAIELTLNKESDSKWVSFKDGKDLIRVKLNDILFIKSEGVYLEVHTLSKTHLCRTSLQSFLEKIDEGNIAQVHRSYVVNLDHVSQFSSDKLTLNENEIPVSRSYKNDLLSHFKN